MNNLNNLMTNLGGIYKKPFVPARLTKAERKRIEKIVAPNVEDSTKYKDFLRQPNTGLFRLFPDFNCQSKNIIRVDGNCANLVPGSWYYSFRRKNYSDKDFLDIQLKDGSFISKGFLSQGILVDLGDLSLENISPEAAGMKFLLEYKPEAELAGAKKQFVQLEKGIETSGYKYSNTIKTKENTTYAIRIIAYKNKINKIATNEHLDAERIKYFMLNYDKRADLTVVFRIVRQDTDGSLTILWKELSRQDSPKIVFRKKDKLSDIRTVK